LGILEQGELLGACSFYRLVELVATLP